MPFSFRHLTHHKMLAGGLLLLLGTGGWAIGGQTWKLLAVTSSRTLPAVVAAQVTPQDGQFEVEQVTIRPYGFEPRAIKRPKGDFLLSFTNRSRQKDLALQLHRVVGASKGEKLKDVGLPKGVVNRLTTLTLQPGEYVLSEASNPRWECRLTITAQ